MITGEVAASAAVDSGVPAQTETLPRIRAIATINSIVLRIGSSSSVQAGYGSSRPGAVIPVTPPRQKPAAPTALGASPAPGGCELGHSQSAQTVVSFQLATALLGFATKGESKMSFYPGDLKQRPGVEWIGRVIFPTKVLLALALVLAASFALMKTEFLFAVTSHLSDADLLLMLQTM